MHVSEFESDEAMGRALAAARETRALVIGVDVLQRTPAVFKEQFGDATAAIIADPRTFEAAGRAVQGAFQRAGVPTVGPFLLDEPDLYAEYEFYERLAAWVASHEKPPVCVAVGSGTINDLTKLAAHRSGRRYMSVATAASMDGYTAFGSSITYRGSKQTFDCPAPQAVVADLDVICKAPSVLSAAGYADLLAKITAGADWILADALGFETIDETAWDLVQKPLMASLADPAGVRRGDVAAMHGLTSGLMMGGFAMQWTRTSRPASGAEHQFSHLWDMQHHTHEGPTPSHGFKVAVGTIAVARLYEKLMAMPLENLDVEAAVRAWPDAAGMERKIVELLGEGELAEKARLEMAAKALTRDALRARLEKLRHVWPALRERLAGQLPGVGKLLEMLKAAGAPTTPGEIGISLSRLKLSHWQAYLIRRRYTVLDLAMEADLLDRII